VVSFVECALTLTRSVSLRLILLGGGILLHMAFLFRTSPFHPPELFLDEVVSSTFWVTALSAAVILGCRSVQDRIFPQGHILGSTPFSPLLIVMGTFLGALVLLLLTQFVLLGVALVLGTAWSLASAYPAPPSWRLATAAFSPCLAAGPLCAWSILARAALPAIPAHALALAAAAASAVTAIPLAPPALTTLVPRTALLGQVLERPFPVDATLLAIAHATLQVGAILLASGLLLRLRRGS